MSTRLEAKPLVAFCSKLYKSVLSTLKSVLRWLRMSPPHIPGLPEGHITVLTVGLLVADIFACYIVRGWEWWNGRPELQARIQGFWGVLQMVREFAFTGGWDVCDQTSQKNSLGFYSWCSVNEYFVHYYLTNTMLSSPTATRYECHRKGTSYTAAECVAVEFSCIAPRPCIAVLLRQQKYEGYSQWQVVKTVHIRIVPLL